MTISFNQVSNDIIASKVAVELNAEVSANSSAVIPQKILAVGQYDNAKTVVDYVPFELTGGLQEVKNKYGYGSMLALEVAKVIRTAGTAIPIFVAPIPDDGAGVVATGTLTVTETATSSGVLYFYVAGQKVAVAVADEDTVDEIAAAIVVAMDALPDLPTTHGAVAGVVTLTSKWKGLTANDITIKQNLAGLEESSQAPGAVTIVIADMSGGAANPDISNVFDYMGGADWFTIPVNPYLDAANLTALENGSVLLNDPLVKRLPNWISGDTDVVATAQALADTRDSEFNTIVHVDSSPSLPFEVAASSAGLVAKSAQIDPARPFKNLVLTDILPGNKLSYDQIDAAEKKGLAETDITSDGRVKVYDFVTTYKTTPGGAPDDAYRYTVTISNLQAKIYSLDVILSSSPFDRAKVIDNATVTSQQYAISPNIYKSFIIRLIDEVWISNVWSKNRDDIVASLVTEINAENPGRLDASLIDIIAVGGRIFAVKYGFAFAPVQ